MTDLLTVLMNSEATLEKLEVAVTNGDRGLSDEEIRVLLAISDRVSNIRTADMRNDVMKGVRLAQVGHRWKNIQPSE